MPGTGGRQFCLLGLRACPRKVPSAGPVRTASCQHVSSRKGIGHPWFAPVGCRSDTRSLRRPHMLVGLRGCTRFFLFRGTWPLSRSVRVGLAAGLAREGVHASRGARRPACIDRTRGELLGGGRERLGPPAAVLGLKNCPLWRGPAPCRGLRQRPPVSSVSRLGWRSPRTCF